MRRTECRCAGMTAEQRGIGQAGTCQQQVGKASNRSPESRICDWNGPDQQLRKIDVGIKAPREGVTTIERKRK